MELSHVENTLNMLIKKYTLFCLSHGARYTSGINIYAMSESEKREMLNNTCANRTYLKRIVATACFQEDIYAQIM